MPVYWYVAPPPATVPLGRSQLLSGKPSYNHHLYPTASYLQSPKEPKKQIKTLSEGFFKNCNLHTSLSSC